MSGGYLRLPSCCDVDGFGVVAERAVVCVARFSRLGLAEGALLRSAVSGGAASLGVRRAGGTVSAWAWAWPRSAPTIRPHTSPKTPKPCRIIVDRSFTLRPNSVRCAHLHHLPEPCKVLRAESQRMTSNLGRCAALVCCWGTAGAIDRSTPKEASMKPVRLSSLAGIFTVMMLAGAFPSAGQDFAASDYYDYGRPVPPRPIPNVATETVVTTTRRIVKDVIVAPAFGEQVVTRRVTPAQPVVIEERRVETTRRIIGPSPDWAE